MKLKKLIADFANWIFIGFTLFGFLLIYLGTGARGRHKSGEPNIYFILIGIILIVPFLIYLLKAHIQVGQSEDAETKRIATLIKTGDRIKVDLKDLEIQNNSYKQEIEVGSGYNGRNEYIDVNHNVILINVRYKNNPIRYELNIDMEVTKLRMHFAIQKETELYVDPTNPSNHYLDLRFLYT